MKGDGELFEATGHVALVLSVLLKIKLDMFMLGARSASCLDDRSSQETILLIFKCAAHSHANVSARLLYVKGAAH